MASEIVACAGCGRLFPYEPGKTRCVACVDEYMAHVDRVHESIEFGDAVTIDDIAAHTGLTPDEIRNIIEDFPSLRRVVDTRAICSRCHRRMAQMGAEFCLDCRLELHKEFSRAVEALERKAKPAAYTPKVPQRASGVVSAMEEKRRLENTPPPQSYT